MQVSKVAIVFLLYFLIYNTKGFTQTGVLQSRVITDTSIILTYSDGIFSTTLELKRKEKTITETIYDEYKRKHIISHFNSYHTEVGHFTAYDSLGGVRFFVDNNNGYAFFRDSLKNIIELDKPQSLTKDEILLKNLYGDEFVKKHIKYFANDFFHYGAIDLMPKEDYTSFSDSSSNTYTKGFKFVSSDGKLVNIFCVPFYYNSLIKKEEIFVCNKTLLYSKYFFYDSISHYRNQAKKQGLTKAKDYVIITFKNAQCKESLNARCSGEIEVNLIEIVRFDTLHGNIVYNIYRFNPWTRKFLGVKRNQISGLEFLYRVINFEDEIYIHRFKDPLIYRPKYIDYLIRVFNIEKYKYILK